MSDQILQTRVSASSATRASPGIPGPQPTRVSERQAARMQAKPQVKTPRIQGNMAKWVMGGTRRDERTWLEKIVEYLHVDPQQEGNPQVLRFLLKEWQTMKTTLHTVATMETVKSILVEMGIPYLRQRHSEDPQSTRAQKWEYWNDNSPAGMKQFAQEYQDTKQGNRVEEMMAAEESDEETKGTENEQYGTIGSMLVEEDNDSQSTMSDKKPTNSPSEQETSTTLAARSHQEQLTEDEADMSLSPRLVTADDATVLDLQLIKQRHATTKSRQTQGTSDGTADRDLIRSVPGGSGRTACGVRRYLNGMHTRRSENNRHTSSSVERDDPQSSRPGTRAGGSTCSAYSGA